MNTQANEWDPGLYDDKHSFVWKHGASVVELLAPQSGEQILDLGCGTGQLTAKIAESGAKVVGIDRSPAMIDQARKQFEHIDFQEADAHDFHFEQPFDAVFSNATLHWITNPEQVIGCISQSLRPGGRLVVEFGGKGNVQRLCEAAATASLAVSGKRISHPWYFPSIADFASVLQRFDIETTNAMLFDRPTPLEGEEGLRNWFRMFGPHWLQQIPACRHEEFFREFEDHARPTLYGETGWFADYRRLRVVAVKV